ncbi:ECF RNA polymerase sigma factor SigW [compost metagenome]
MMSTEKAGENMDFTESLIQEYAKRIFGFAYLKTNDYHNAEDLSQEIIVALCDGTIAYKNIDNMDAYIYRICCYSWSKYLRKSKPGWEALNHTSTFETMQSDTNLEEGLIQKELSEKLRQEIMYLSKTKRDITVMYYYENKSGNEISNILGIPASTVRWHLSQAKMNLKERIIMTTEHGIYKPIRLSTGRNGWGEHDDPCGLHKDVLMQNVCWICHGQALTIEEIARTLGVAAVYLEDTIDKLLYMDYLKTVNKNKYQTHFFIPDAKYQLTERKFHLENTLPMAEQFYQVIVQALPRIKETINNSTDFDDDVLIWQFLPVVVFRTIQKTDSDIIQAKGLQHSAPKRKDGSKHWACASVRMSDILEGTSDISAELRDFCLQGGGNGIKLPVAGKMHALQFDLGFLGGHRHFGPTELSQLKRVHEIIMNGEVPNHYDKEIISTLIRKGYVSHTDENLKILIPYLTATEMQAVNQILQTCADELLNIKEIEKTFFQYIHTMNKEIPAFVENNERNHLLSGFSPYITILWLLYKNDYLRKPPAEELEHICTVVWEE